MRHFSYNIHQSRKFGKPYYFKVLGSKKAKVQNSIEKTWLRLPNGYLREESLSFDNYLGTLINISG